MENTQDIEVKVIRVSKEDSSFVYFTLESNEGIAFYSTLRESLNQLYRDIEINYSPSVKNQINNILEQLELRFPISYL